MEILSPEDRVVLWRAAIDADGSRREALMHAIAKEIVSSLGALDLYEDQYAQLTLESLQTLDDAGVFASDSLRAVWRPCTSLAGGPTCSPLSSRGCYVLRPMSSTWGSSGECARSRWHRSGGSTCSVASGQSLPT